MKKLLLGIGSILSLYTFADVPKWHSYRLARFPKSEVGCVGTAMELGEKFAKVTGQTVFRALCEKESKEGYDILIAYLSPTPVRFVSTVNESGGLGYLGVYRTQEDCVKALPREVEVFSKNTELTPFVSYCFKESDLNLTPYLARIDAWGDAKSYPYRFEENLFSSHVDDAARVLRSMSESAKASGIPVHQVTFSHDGSLKLVIRFYGDVKKQVFHSRYFKMNEVARYSSQGTRTPLAACRSQFAESVKGFASSFTTPGIWLCTWDNQMFESRLYLLRIRREDGIHTDFLPDRYSTFEACDRERPANQAWYEKTFGITPFAVVCTWDIEIGTGKPDAFVMRILTKTTFEAEPSSWPLLGLTPRLFGKGDSQ